eukprot:m.39586 g.39586  ORF g.39586 m.39586 type:complete len:51 (+) comp16642_c1_seq3:124-276(+)
MLITQCFALVSPEMNKCNSSAKPLQNALLVVIKGTPHEGQSALCSRQTKK